MSSDSLKKILKEIKIANEQWKTGKLDKKPDILLLGPKPLYRKQRAEEPKYPIFPVQETRAEAKSYVAERKLELTLLEDRTTSVKEKILVEESDKEKAHLARVLVELNSKFDRIIKEIREYKKLERRRRSQKRKKTKESYGN